MKHYLGIDGGGSNTTVAIMDDNEQILFKNTSGPSAIDTVDSETTIQAIEKALAPYMSQHKGLRFDGVFVGIGGLFTDQERSSVKALVRRLPYVDDQTDLRVSNDMETALFSGGTYDSGIALISGTGMVAYGKHLGKEHKCGGWGYKEGDLGSAYHLGREALRYLARTLDHRYEPDNFSAEIAAITKINDIDDLLPGLNRYFGERTKTAQLAPIVTKYANLNHSIAKAIVDRATDELLLAVKGVYNALAFDETTLVVIGGLGNADGYFKESLYKKILASLPHVSITTDGDEPAVAAAKAAKHFIEEEEV